MTTLDWKKHTILIVDDDSDILELLQEVFQHEGCNVITAPDGRAALAILRSTHGIDAVLTDIKMPHMSGITLMREARNDGLMVPFVVLSGFGDKAMVLEALRLGAYDFLDKPTPMDQVIKVMSQAVALGQTIGSLSNAIKDAETSADPALSKLKILNQAGDIVRLSLAHSRDTIKKKQGA